LAKKERHSFVNGPFGSDLLTSEITETGVPIIYIRDLTPNKYSRVSQSCVTEQKAKQLSAFQTSPGDVLIAKVGDPPGVATVYPENEPLGIVTQDVIRIKPDEQVVLSEYLAYVLNSNFMGAIIDQISVASTRTRISLGDFKQIRLFTPPLSEQKAIAFFLDRETAKIDALIAKKEQLIELLQEKRTAIISHAVTKGLDPTVPMKDSGVEWLGDIPTHWEVKRLKFISDIQSGVAKGRDLGDRNVIELPYLRVANVQDGYLDLSDIATITIGKNEIERYLLRAGDVLMNEGGDYDKLGRGAVWQGQIEPCIHQNHVYAVRPHQVVNPYWINTVTLTSYAKHYFILKSKQSTNLASISSTNLKELPVVIPPASECDAILAYLDEKTTQIDALIVKIREGIEKLKEYRTALISAAVTGKIDVRNEVA
jgi:type I restriction enzyme S subunit